MKMPKIFAILILPLLASISAFGQGDSSTAGTDTVRTVASTIYFAGYRADNIAVKDENNWYMNEIEVYLCDKKLLTSVRWYPSPGLNNFNYDPNGVKKPCYIQDINNDGRGEIIIRVISGGNNGWESTYIYTLDTMATQIGNFNGIDTGLNSMFLRDLDDDSIPELLSNDMNYECWHYGCSNSPAPWLVWKWDGSKYRLANLKLGKTIMMKLNNIDVRYPDLDIFIEHLNKIESYEPSKDGSYPEELLDLLLAFEYAGYPKTAKRIFNTVWADSVDNKKLFWDDLQEKLHSVPYWKELQESNW